MPRQSRQSKSRKKIYNNPLTLDQGQEQLLIELIESIRNNQTETCAFLLESQSQHTIELFFSELQNNQMYAKHFKDKSQIESTITKLNQIWRDIQSKADSKKEKEEHNNNIRKINQKVYEGNEGESQDSLEKFSGVNQIKKNILEQRFGYILFGNIKCLMIAYGDLNPIEPSIKIMHSQIELFFKIIISGLTSVKKGPKDEGEARYSILIESKNDFINYLRRICEKDVKEYEQISKVYSKVKRKTKLKSDKIGVEDVYSEQDSSEHFSGSQNEDSDQQDRDQKHLQTKDVTQMQYFVDLTQKMNEKQYQTYCQSRYISLLYPKRSPEARKKFVKLIDPAEKIKQSLYDLKLLEICSFVGCRFIKRIIFDIIRTSNTNNKDRLTVRDQPLKMEEITHYGNRILESYQKKVKEVQQQCKNIQEKAYQLFCHELKDCQIIREIIPKALLQKYKENYSQLWKQNKFYQKSWEQRIEGQSEIDTIIIRNLRLEKGYEGCQKDLQEHHVQSLYGQFIANHIQHYYTEFVQYYQTETKPLSFHYRQDIFRKYLTGDSGKSYHKEGLEQKRQKSSLQQIVSRPRKKIKLESLKD